MRSQLARLIVVLLAVSVLGGCVAQGKYDRMQRLYRTSQEQIVDLQAQLEEARSRIKALEQAKSEDPQAQKRIEELKKERDQLRQALADAKKKLQSQASTGGTLPERVDEELQRLAANNDELTYVQDKGMVKFASDVTFGLGSAQVSNEAKQTVQQVAQVLQTPAAQPFDVRIVGHTDAVPIEKPSTKKNHPTNWHLSVHRAIAIEKVLEGSGVSPKRMGVAGYGQYRPIAPNGPDGSNKKNRRVELYLHQRGPAGGSMPAGDSESESESAPARTKSGSQGGSDNAPDEDAPVRYK